MKHWKSVEHQTGLDNQETHWLLYPAGRIMPPAQLYGCLEAIKVHLAGSETIFFSVQMWQF